MKPRMLTSTNLCKFKFKMKFLGHHFMQCPGVPYNSDKYRTHGQKVYC